MLKTKEKNTKDKTTTDKPKNTKVKTENIRKSYKRLYKRKNSQEEKST